MSARRPPPWAEWLVRLAVPERDRDEVLTGMEDLFRRRVESHGAGAARRWYARHAWAFVWRMWGARVRSAGVRRASDRGGGGMGEVVREVREALRRLSRAPVFTAVSVLTMGVGIGAFAAIFSVVDGVLLEPPPYQDPEELVWVWRDYTWFGLDRGWLGGPDIAGLRGHDGAFAGVVGFRNGGRNLTGREGDNPRRVRVTFASHELFDVLGVEPAHGRGFAPEDDVPGAAAVAVLGHELWRSHFAADRGIIGRDVFLNGEATTVVGIAPADFRFVVHSALGDPSPADLYQPMRIDLTAEDPGSGAFAGLARVRGGATPAEVEAAIAAVAQDLDDLWGNPGLRMWSVGLHEDLVVEIRPALTVLLAAAGFLLLILGANLATLLLGRATARDRELAVRAALGAGRGRLFRTVLTESAVLAGAGALLGLGLAFPALEALRALAPEGLPRLTDVTVDPSVVVVALSAALVMGVGAGALPAWRSLRGGVSQRLREGGGRGGSGLSGLRTRSALVVAQVALSLMLLVGAGLLARGFLVLLDTDPGVDGRSVLTFTAALDPGRYGAEGAIADFDRRFRAAVSRLPGVQGVGAVDALPLTATASQRTVAFPGAPGNRGVDEDEPLIDYFYAGHGYAEAVGLRLLEGRAFNEGDDAEGPGVALVDDLLAKRFYPGGGALGGSLSFAGDTLTIVGVVDHARHYAIHSDDRPQVYVPLVQRPQRSTLSWAVAATGDPGALAPAIRRVLDGVDASVPLTDVRTLDEIVQGSLGNERLSLTLLLAFAAGALALATLGIYGVVSNAVARRTHEMGVRIALGANRSKVLGMVLGQGLRLVALGIVLGLAGSIAGARVVGSLVVGADPGDPLVYTAVILGLIALTSLATGIPALRATRIDPVEALRPD